MRFLLAAICLPFFLTSFAQERPAPVQPSDVDPNTKIEGGADLRGSGAAAGAGAGPDKKIENPQDKRDLEKEKPTSERKPQEREREEADKAERVPQR